MNKVVVVKVRKEERQVLQIIIFSLCNEVFWSFWYIIMSVWNNNASSCFSECQTFPITFMLIIFSFSQLISQTLPIVIHYHLWQFSAIHEFIFYKIAKLIFNKVALVSIIRWNQDQEKGEPGGVALKHYCMVSPLVRRSMYHVNETSVTIIWVGSAVGYRWTKCMQ